MVIPNNTISSLFQGRIYKRKSPYPISHQKRNGFPTLTSGRPLVGCFLLLCLFFAIDNNSHAYLCSSLGIHEFVKYIIWPSWYFVVGKILRESTFEAFIQSNNLNSIQSILQIKCVSSDLVGEKVELPLKLIGKWVGKHSIRRNYSSSDQLRVHRHPMTILLIYRIMKMIKWMVDKDVILSLREITVFPSIPQSGYSQTTHGGFGSIRFAFSLTAHKEKAVFVGEEHWFFGQHI